MYFTQKVMSAFALSAETELSSSDVITRMICALHIEATEQDAKKVRVTLSRLVKSGQLAVAGQHRHKKYRFAEEA